MNIDYDVDAVQAEQPESTLGRHSFREGEKNAALLNA